MPFFPGRHHLESESGRLYCIAWNLASHEVNSFANDGLPTSTLGSSV